MVFENFTVFGREIAKTTGHRPPPRRGGWEIYKILENRPAGVAVYVYIDGDGDGDGRRGIRVGFIGLCGAHN